MAANSWDEPFLRTVAVLQLNQQLVDQKSDQLTELADMQAQRRINSDLAEYVAAHAKYGTIPANPLAKLKLRLNEIASFFAKSEELYRTTVASHARFIADGLPQVSLAEIHQAQTELEQSVAKLPARLQALVAGLSPLDWDDSGTDADLHPELFVCAQGMDVKLPKAAGARRDLRRLALGDGKLHAEIQTHFQRVRVRLAELLPIHARHSEALQQTAAHVGLGNHLAAAEWLKAEGLQKKSFCGFSDLNYAQTQADLAALCATVHAAVSFAHELPARCRRVLDNFQKLATTSQRDEGRATTDEALTGLNREFEAHWNVATAQPGSEVEKECRPRLEAAWATLTQAEPKLQALALQGEETWQAEARKQRRNLQLAAVGVLIMVAGAFYFGILPEMRRAAKEQAAEAKALAEKRLEWTGKAMQRAGMKAETVKRTLTQGGTVVAWGNNDKGQTTVPAGLSGVVAIAAGHEHTVALRLD